MHLASVRDLKQELFSSPAADLVGNLATAFGVRTRSARTTVGKDAMSGIALGAVKVKKQYKLAIRQQESGPLIHAMTEEIRKRAKGEVNVQYVGKLVKYALETRPAFYRAKRRPLRIGSSISDVHTGFISAGTLGCFVAGRKSPRYLAMLTNNHVIADENANSSGDLVFQQGTLDGGKKSTNLVGELWKFIRLKKTGVNSVDAALGAIYEGVDFDELKIGTRGNLRGLGDASTLPERAFVHKVGRTTGQTKGRVTAFDIDNVTVQYGIGVIRFNNQIEIEGTGNKAFSDSGDSGSMIVDKDRNAIGLLFAGGDVGGSNGKGLTYANPMETVLDALDVDLVV